MLKVLVYPTSENPYQNLLYKEFDSKKIRIKYVNGINPKFHSFALLLTTPFKIIWYRLCGYKVFHLHWVAFNFPSSNFYMKFFSFIFTIFNILLIKVLDYKLVWTVHNTMPHDSYTSNDFLISKLLFLISDKKIIHSKSILKEIKKYKFNFENTYVIPHGNFSSYYPNKVSKLEARTKLDIKNKDFVFLFFGMIKSYKGIDKLLFNFSKLTKSHKKVLLLIAGKSYNETLTKLIHEYQTKLNKSIRINLKHIDDNEIQYYMNAADVVVYPFQKVTTSGSVLLALSFNKTIIYPKIGALKDIPYGIGYSYTNSEKDNLFKSLNLVIQEKKDLHVFEKNIKKYNKSIEWKHIADKTQSIYLD